jgi:plasmid maintenance system antidote protein VapI
MTCDNQTTTGWKGGEFMNINKLKAKIVERGMNVEQLAEAIEIDRSSLYRKLNAFEKITIGEAGKMKNVLGMSNEEAYEIFLA